MDIEKCSYIQAIQILAERSGVSLPEPDDEGYRQRSEMNKNLQNICLEAARFFYRNLIGDAGKPAQAYLLKRALTKATCRRFGLGYAVDEWDALYRHLTSLGYTDQDLLLKSGLFRRGKSGGLYDLFRHRLMFPIFDAMGRVVAFGGRVLDDSLPKYINSPETPIYTKGRHLYALNLAKSSHQKQLVIVEGYMDVIAMHQAGVDQTVASLGTALTENQAQLLRKYTEEVIVAYDADAAGQAAILRSLDILRQKGLKVTILMIPDGKDPDEYIRRNGAERFHALLEKALPLLDYKLLTVKLAHTEGQNLDILAYQEEACRLLAHEDNAIVRELYGKRLSEELHMTPDTVMREIERRYRQPETEPTDPAHRKAPVVGLPAESPAESQDAQVSREELYLIGLMAADPTIYEQLKPVVDDFSPGVMQEFAGRVLSRAAEQKLDASALVELSGDLVVRRQPLHELMVRVSMRLEETFGRQDLSKAAAEQLWRQRRKRLLDQKNQLPRLIETAETEAEKGRLRQKLRELDLELTRKFKQFTG